MRHLLLLIRMMCPRGSDNPSARPLLRQAYYLAVALAVGAVILSRDTGVGTPII